MATLSPTATNITDMAVLLCLITGFPEPDVIWRKNNEILMPDPMRISIDLVDFEEYYYYTFSGSGSVMDSESTSDISITDLIR